VGSASDSERSSATSTNAAATPSTNYGRNIASFETYGAPNVNTDAATDSDR
jgi:hypothetical protein